MNDLLGDIEVTPSPDRGPRKSASVWPVIAAGIVVVVAAGIAWNVWLRDRTKAPIAVAPVETPSPAPEPVPEQPPLGAQAAAGAEPIEIPSLGESDALVRRLAGELSADSDLGRWLSVDGLAMRFVASVVNVAEGFHPRKHLPVQAPPKPFAVVTRGGASYAASSSHERYDPWVNLFVRLDPQAVASIYGRLRPLFNEAYRELGYPGGDFDRAMEQAMERLLAVPVPASPPPIEPKIKSWIFADPAMESLDPVAKQILRLGPRNQRALQTHLRAIAQALGM